MPFLQRIVSSVSILCLALKDNHWWHQRRWWLRGCSPGRLHLSKRTLPANRYKREIIPENRHLFGYYFIWCVPYTLSSHIDLAKPKSGALFSLFSNPSLLWINTVINSPALAVEDFLQGPVGGMGRVRRIDEVWNLGKMFSQLAKRWTRMLVSGIFKQLRTLVVVPNVLSKFSKTRNVCFSR